MADRIEALERLARAFRTLPEKTLSRTVIEPAMKKALNPLLTELKGYIGTTYTKQSKGNLKKAATLRTVVKHGVTYGYVYFRYKPIGTQKNGRKKKTASLYVRWLTNGTRNIHGTNFVVNFRKKFQGTKENPGQSYAEYSRILSAEINSYLADALST